MAASDNLAMEPWVYRPTTFADSWISEAFTRDTKAFTLALQKSLSNNNNNNSSSSSNFDSADSDLLLPFLNTFQPETTPTPTPTVSGVSGSDPESVAAPKRQRNAIPVSGKVAKRKSRASKRTQTTFITADPANFRQMVQQVTGVRFSNGQISCMPTIVKPEPQRPGGRLPGGGCLPTLDTSAFLLDHQQQQRTHAGPASAGGGGVPVGPGCFGLTDEVGEGGSVSAGAAGGLGFDSYSSFPTLESWKVM